MVTSSACMQYIWAVGCSESHAATKRVIMIDHTTYQVKLHTDCTQEVVYNKKCVK